MNFFTSSSAEFKWADDDLELLLRCCHNFPTWCQRQRFLTLLCFLCQISSLVMELWQFSFMRDWQEILKSEIQPSEFCPISGDWGKLWVPNLARMSLTEFYWMLQNSKVTAFAVLELLRENQLGRSKITAPPTTPRLGLKDVYAHAYLLKI